jgi:hypothetical protein
LGWFLGWPIVVLACIPSVKPVDTLEACVFGAGSLLWFLSCFGTYGFLFAIVEDTRRRSPALYLGVAAVILSCFFGYPVLVVVSPLLLFADAPTDNLPGWIIVSDIFSGMVALGAEFWIYETLFNLAEARWPAVKEIRKVVAPVLGAFMFHRHHDQ